MYKIAAVVWCLLLWLPFAQAQTQPVAPQPKVILKLHTTPQDAPRLRGYSYQSTHPDSVTAAKEVKALVYQMQQDAYLLTSADSLFLRNDTLHVKLYIGNRFEYARLRNGNLSEGILIESGFREKFYRDVPFKPAEYVKLQQRILDYAERNGYPFASVWLDTIKIENGKIDAALMVEKAFVVTYDSVQVMGGSKTKPKFLMRYLQLQPGQPYNQEQIEATQRMLTALPYIRITRPPQVRFARDKARVIYFLEDRQANQVDGIVGFLPDPTRQDKLLITGEANLNIRNIKGTGKSIGLQWRRVNKGSVILNGEYLHPNLFGTPFELGTRFSLLKQDSSFITIQPRLQLGYYTLKYGKFSVYGEWRNSRILGAANPQSLRNLDLADARTSTYGFNYIWNNLDDFYFPRSGRLVEFDLAAGTKTLLRNPDLEKSFYDTLDMRTTQLSISLRAENFFRVSKNSALLARLQGEALLNDQLFLNDMYRLGGLTSIRGFDDYFFYASSYAIGTIEYRLFTASDSYVLLFYDQAYYRSELEKSKASGWPSGVGGGISFSTGAGIFQLVYSVGCSEQQPLSLKYSKIHFGITSKF
ncbi:BamA/TamA family outer membrane protein [Pontibacter sp. Tf4]|uniref:BamA/TamA family outer membrane protein n=1 Tax=Pontibacter sp. Tf4 TaxID=2761620 RepID=UPI001627FE67|nr:BamA/TamA family outer membrane protein [Pontibacter sp. Tf4]MBB6609675.1 BamA/TamA family outer membrane protein [Pontibacter sp. Tf4]